MDNYKVIEQKLANRESFKGNSMYAVSDLERAESSLNPAPKYLVFSYSTLIASYDYNTEEFWVNPRKYSVTTSRQQNLIKRAWGIK